jgi:hypothetical protein
MEIEQDKAKGIISGEIYIPGCHRSKSPGMKEDR